MNEQSNKATETGTPSDADKYLVDEIPSISELKVISLQQQFTTALARVEELTKDKERLDWLERKTPLALWMGIFSDSEYNISLGRAGAPICTISSMDDDGHEVDKELSGGDSLRTAIDTAIQGLK